MHLHVTGLARFALAMTAAVCSAEWPTAPRSALAAPQGTIVTVDTLLAASNGADGKCSLVEALNSAFNADGLPVNECPGSTGTTVIAFSVAGVISFSQDLPNIVNNVTLVGPITLHNPNTHVIFDVDDVPAARLVLEDVTLSGAATAIDNRGRLIANRVRFVNNATTISGGAIRNAVTGTASIAGSIFIANRAGAAADGGAIHSSGVLTVADSIFTGNAAGRSGGAIAIAGGSAAVFDSVFEANTARGSAGNTGGGALHISNPLALSGVTLRRSVFIANRAPTGFGGAVFHDAGAKLDIADATFEANVSGNWQNNGSGGAIRNHGALVIDRATFSANAARGTGGALANDLGGATMLSNVAFLRNSATDAGGAIANLNGSAGLATLNAAAVLLSGNVAGGIGGGIYNRNAATDLATFGLSLLSGNLPQDCADGNGPASPAAIVSAGYNIASDTTCGIGEPTDQVTDSMLEPPALNSGRVPSMYSQKPLPVSPAVDAVWPISAALSMRPGDWDMRGYPRPLNGDGVGIPAFDLGPVELEDAAPRIGTLPAPGTTIDVGSSPQGVQVTRLGALSVFNSGVSTLTLLSLNLTGTHPADFAFSLPSLGIGPGASTIMDLRCTPGPGGPSTRTATLTLGGNDPGTPFVMYSLTCTRVTTPSPRFDAAPVPPGPASVTATVGTAASIAVTVREIGNAPLVLSNGLITATPPGEIVLATSFPITIADGAASQMVTATCQALSPGLKTASLTFNTNDAGLPVARFDLTCDAMPGRSPMLGQIFSSTTDLGPLNGPYGIAVSADGRNAYVADAGQSRLLMYTMEPTGALSHRSTISSVALGAGNRFTTPLQVAVSPDGRNVYATGYNAKSIAAFARDPISGTLSWIDTVREGEGYGCSGPCAGNVSGLGGAYGIVLSQDGDFVYVTSIFSDSVVVLRRDAATGMLSDLDGPGTGANFVQRYTHPLLNSAYGLAISPGGAHVYVAGYTSDSLLVLDREPVSGTLTTRQVITAGTVPGLNGVFRLAMSPDGNFVYTAGFDSDSVCAFRRDRIGGTLQSAGCVTHGAGAPALDAASDLAITPDGRFLLATAYNSDALTVFARDASGGGLTHVQTITRSAGGTPPINGARGVAIAPDGRAAYVTGYLDNATVSFPFINPVPAATAVLPAARLAGSGAFSLTVIGTGFLPTSVVRWNGADRTTTYANETRLIAGVDAPDIASAGARQVTVFNPSPGGGTSNILTFTAALTIAAPSVDQIWPQAARAGDAARSLRIDGRDFPEDAQALWNNSARPTTRVSSTVLWMQLATDDLARPGINAVRVRTSGAPDSNALRFVVASPSAVPAPTIEQLSPASAIQLADAQLDVAVYGHGFVLGSQAWLNGQARPTAYGGPSLLTMTLNGGDLGWLGPSSVRVTNPGPGGGGSNIATFYVLATGSNALPAVTAMTVCPAGAGFNLVLRGTGFQANTQVLINGVPKPSRVLSATRISVQMTGPPAMHEPFAVTARNPQPAGGESWPMVTTLVSCSALVPNTARALTTPW